MRHFVRIPTLLVIAAGGAFADEPKATPAPAAEAAAPPAQASAADKPSATVTASRETESPSQTSEQIDRLLRAKGYTPRMINGKKFYCRGEDVLGTRLQHAQQCAPADQLNVQQRTSQEGVTRMQHSNFGLPKDGGHP